MSAKVESEKSIKGKAANVKCRMEGCIAGGRG